MRRKQAVYYTEMSPFVAIGLALLALGAFFLTLPILIAALVVFGTFAAYMAWRFTKMLKQAQEEMLKNQEAPGETIIHNEEIVIDITPEEDDRPGIRHDRP